MRTPSFALTVDVEEWFQVENLRGVFPHDQWQNAPSRIAESMKILLSILTEEQVDAATFFVLGWIAKRHPDLIKSLSDAGYEIASHGMDHRLNSELGREEIERDLRESKMLLEELTGRPILGYRAPSFSVNEGVIDALRSSGYQYDSSFNDVSWHDRYGRLNLSGYSRSEVGTFIYPDKDFREMPISNLPVFGRTIPWGGGGWFASPEPAGESSWITGY